MLTELIEANRATLLKRWFESILEGYPSDVAGLLRREADPFLNPVGSTISREIGTVLDELRRGGGGAGLSAALDAIVQIRAVQEMEPSRAVGFVFLLKRVVRETVDVEGADPRLQAELQEFESRVDGAALLAFDLYLKHRERIHEIRTKEVRERSERLMERMSRIYGIREPV